jgi:hypothetical protein
MASRGDPNRLFSLFFRGNFMASGMFSRLGKWKRDHPKKEKIDHSNCRKTKEGKCLCYLAGYTAGVRRGVLKYMIPSKYAKNRW